MIRSSMAVCLVLASASAQSQALPIDAGKVFIGVSTFDLVYEGERQGRWRYQTSYVGDAFVVAEETAWTARNIVESASVTADRKAFLPRTLKLDGDFDGNLLTVDLTWRGTAVSGVYGRKPADQTELVRSPYADDAAPPAYERTALFGLLSGIDLSPGDYFTFDWFNVFARATESVTLSVGQRETISTPAGDFEVLPVDLQVPSQSNVVYVTVDSPRRMVRVDVTGQPMIFELAAP